MSAIDRNTIGSERSIQPSTPNNKSNAIANVTQLAATELRKAEGRRKLSGLKRLGQAVGLRSVKAIAPTDTDGLAGMSNEDMLGDLARILTLMEAEDAQTGGDPVSQLCRTMLEENARRVALIIEAKHAQ